MKIIQKLLSVSLVVVFLGLQVITVSAITAPTPPPTPTQETTAPTPPPAPSPPTPSIDPSPSLEPSPGLTTSQPTSEASGNVGDTNISTGDATNSATITTTGDTNVSTTSGTDSESVVAIQNTQNGAGSSSTGTVVTEKSTQTNQNNIALVNSSLNLDSTTGKNSGSYNVGKTELTTGDANTSGTIITAANTNVAGVAVSEFNVNDNHTGDIILNFAGSGVGSTAQGTFQNNEGTAGNTLTLSADSGNNKGNYNTGGNTSMTTGDANVAANVLTFLNNNIAGNIIYGVVNIFGNLVGDIILPEIANLATSTTTTNTTIFQTNSADIDNNLILTAQTGDNSTSYNTGGPSGVQTGEASINTKVLNIANSNIAGGNYWLVLINQAGQWIGKLLGAPDGSTMVGSPGTNLSVNEKGEVVANINSETNATIEQSNNAKVKNDINLTANTGGNSTNYNTGGVSTIKTGDAKIIANLVNFVNNNITGGGKLFVTVVNVFGSWIGDFVTPGTKKEAKQKTTIETVASTQSNPSSAPEASLNSGGIVLSKTKKIVTEATKTNLSNIAQVAGIRIVQDLGLDNLPSLSSAFEELAADETKDTININLAWLLLILLLLGLTYWINLKLISWRRW